MKKLTKYTPERVFTIEEDGFHGTYYKPLEDKYPGKVMILLGGSAGSYMLTEMCAEKYFEAGLNVMAMAYRDVPGAPSELAGIPLELIENGIRWCKNNIASETVVSGISLGGQLALLMGAYFPELVSAVIAVNPMNFSQQGMSSFAKLRFTKGSCFTLHGKDLPYYPIGVSEKEFRKQVKRAARRSHEFINLAEFYRQAVSDMPKDADYLIPAEKIEGPVLLQSAGMDVMLPSYEICVKICERLKEKGFRYPYRHLNYEVASHYLCPAKPLTSKMFRVERRNAKECDRSRKQAFEDAMKFIGGLG